MYVGSEAVPLVTGRNVAIAISLQSSLKKSDFKSPQRAAVDEVLLVGELYTALTCSQLWD